MTLIEERREKLKRVRAYMKKAGLEVVFLTTRPNFSWLTAGGLNYVAQAQSEGVTTLAVTAKKAYILANAIEAPRMMAEELSAKEFTLVAFPWHSDAARREAVMDLVGKNAKRAAADTDLCGLRRLGADFTALRYSLTAGEVARYKQLGLEVSTIMQVLGHEIKPGDTEHDVAAGLAQFALTQGIRPFVNLVAADERIEKFRHPIPTNRKIRKRVMYVICGERGGLVIAATRLVNFGKPNAVLRRKHEAVCRVDAAMILSTHVGCPVAEAFQAGIDAYAREGFADEWLLHHQGGPIGYEGREYVATPQETRLVQPNQAFAWNPSITGTKSEDTVLATAKGVEPLSGPINAHGCPPWPVIEAEFAGQMIPRADILVR